MSIFALQEFFMIWLSLFSIIRVAQMLSSPRDGWDAWMVHGIFCAAVAGCIVYLRGEWLLYLPSFLALLLSYLLSVKLFSTLDNGAVFLLSVLHFFGMAAWMWTVDMMAVRLLGNGLGDLDWMLLVMVLQTILSAAALSLVGRCRRLLGELFSRAEGWGYYVLVLLPFVVVVAAFAKWTLDTDRFYRFLAELAIYFSVYEADALHKLIIFGLLLAGLLFLLIVFLLNQIMRLGRVQKERALILSRNESLLSSYMGMQRYYHDLKNHLSTLQYLMAEKRYEQVDQYLEQILQDRKSLFQYVATGDPFVDAILNSKIGDAKKKGIHVECDVQYPRDAEISAIDICSILANLLDNALEACGEMEEGWIRIVIGNHNQFLTVRVENTTATDPFANNPRLATTKSKKELHGIGLRSVRMAAKKYNGSVQLRYTGGIFTADNMLCYQLRAK